MGVLPVGWVIEGLGRAPGRVKVNPVSVALNAFRFKHSIVRIKLTHGGVGCARIGSLSSTVRGALTAIAIAIATATSAARQSGSASV